MKPLRYAPRFASLFSDTTPLDKLMFVQLPPDSNECNGLEHGFEPGEVIVIDMATLPTFGDLCCFVTGKRFHLRRFAVGCKGEDFVGIIVGRCSKVRHGAGAVLWN